MMESSSVECAVLNRLIVACNDDMRVQSAAARIVTTAERRGRLADSVGRRKSFIQELEGLVSAGGITPASAGSPSEAVFAAFAFMRGMIVGGNSGDAYARCERVEARTELLYERAVKGELLVKTRNVLARQYAEVMRDRVDLRRASMGG